MCGAMEADPFEQPYWNLDQYLIWLASRDPAAVLRATDRPNSDASPPIGWRMHREPNLDRQKVEMAAVRAMMEAVRVRAINKRGRIKTRIEFNIEFNGEWVTPDDPEWFADCVIDFEGEPTFAALLMRTTKHGRREEVRPQFNPPSIARLYPAPTPSHIDRPDVENPVVGPYIAYFNAWVWLVDRNSRQELLPIDEADSCAKETIRRICINTPKKLTMWGFCKGDPKLKAITRQDWQGLSIDPLHGQPEADLKAVGYRREYGAATDGEYGSVIWTGLCFDRKEFFAAFETGSGNGPRPTQLGERILREQPSREQARRELKKLYPNGVPDKSIVSNAKLVRAVNDQIKECGQQGVSRLSRHTILRAAGRLK